MRILYVEDHRDSADVLAKALTGEGFDVAVARTLGGGRQAVADGEFDLLLCDLMLPDGDGCELMQELALRGDGPPGIALTACAFDSDIERALRAGFAAHVCKPCTVENLLAAIHKVVPVVPAA